MNRRPRGFAMILVIWALVVLTALATGFSRAVRHETRTAIDLDARVRAEAATVAGINSTLLKLGDPDPERRWIADNAVRKIAWPGAAISVRVKSESGRIDLNRGVGDVLGGLFEQLFPDHRSQALADAVIDWRDRDNQPRDQGAEADDYARAGLDYGPANAPFRSVHELARVLGFDGAMAEAARPYLTIHSGSPRINAGSADLIVLTAIPGISRTQAEDFIAQREPDSGADVRTDIGMLRGAGQYLSTNTERRMFALDIEVSLEDGYRQRGHVVVRLDKQKGFKLLSREARPLDEAMSQDQP